MSDNDMGGRKMNGEEDQSKKSVAKKRNKKERPSGKLRLIKGGAAERRGPHQHERQKQPKAHKRPTREEREEMTIRVVNRRFVNAAVCFGLIAFLVSYLLPEYDDHALIIGICAGSLVYVGLHIVNFIKCSRQLAYKLGSFILSTLLVSALIYWLVNFIRG